jgi:hypothetical protein
LLFLVANPQFPFMPIDKFLNKKLTAPLRHSEVPANIWGYDISSAVLPISMEARPHYLHSETWEGQSATLFVSSNKSSERHWQVV